MPPSLFQRVVVPVANRTDARTTAAGLQPYLGTTVDDILVVHVIEKAGGALDKASVEQRERDAEEIFGVMADQLAGQASAMETEILYGTNIAEAIIDCAHDVDATAIVFTPRGGSKWMKILTEDVTTGLINESDVPILVLPDIPEE